MKNLKYILNNLYRSGSKFILIIFVLQVSVLSQAEISPDQLKKVAYSKQWIRLLHYNKKLLGGYESRVDGKNFFFAADGNTNPLSELKASLDAALKDIKVSRLDLPPLCAFPERYRFLAESFKLKYPKPVCEKYNNFINFFSQPDSVSLIFSAAYPNNPASMFGHSFLKINSSRKIGLLDGSINYAAQVADNENPLAFFFFGISGGYVGKFSTLPFYVKVSEYNNTESRDLWEYKLTLSKEETLRLLNHIWEVEVNSHFFYYFFDENCSFLILKMLEAIKPDWDLIGDDPLHVIPGESIKAVTEFPGTYSDVKFWPSLHKKLFQYYDSLSSEEYKQFIEIIEKKREPNSVKSRKVIATVSRYLDYIRNEKKTHSKELQKIRPQVLQHQAQLGQLSADEKKTIKKIDRDTRPDFGHDSYNISLSQAYINSDSFEDTNITRFKFKFAYHDLLNNDLGYSPYAHIDFPSIELSYLDQEKKFDLESIGFLNTTSLHPITAIDKRFSWKFNSGLYTARQYGCLSCKHVFLELGIGSSFALFNRRNLFYSLVQARTEFYSRKHKGYFAGPGFDLGFIINPWKTYKARLNTELLWDINHGKFESKYFWKHNFSQSLFASRNFEVRNVNSYIEGSRGQRKPISEFHLQLHYFFR